jgi:multicomponent K+:H+ antiporter subunit D
VNALVIAPVGLPMIIGATQLLLARNRPAVQRLLAVAGAGALLAIALRLVVLADSGVIRVYAVGDWEAPLGIVLVLDRLSAYMLLLAALVALGSLAYAVRGWDLAGPNFHPLFMFQLAGINGAFLTGDLFNLFVFFEILLIASYCLMLHGGGEARLRAGTIYVVLNLVGSALFLIAVGLLYGVAGTLNIADLGRAMAGLDAGGAGLARVGAVLLLVVFGLKAALVPLHLWLPEGYGEAAAPVAALFAIMTKVGAYCILRVFTVVFGPLAGELSWLVQPWLLAATLATLWLGMLGAVASRALGELVAFLLIASVGTLLLAFALFTVPAITAGLYYLAHSTLVTAGLFLLIEPISRQRGSVGGRLAPGPPLRQRQLLGWSFLIGMVAVVGLPPLSGFLGKMLLLQSATGGAAAGWIYATVLLTGLLGLIGCSRAGNLVFWDTGGHAGERAGAAARAGALVPPLAMIGSSVVLTVGAGPILEYAQAAAQQVVDPTGYIRAVLGETLSSGRAR